MDEGIWGDASDLEEGVFEQNLTGVRNAIVDADVDVVLLQEVDLGASRSHEIHQGEWLLGELGWGYLACVETWTNRYVPFPYWPPARQYGSMRSGQCVLSRYPLTSNTRVRLPQPASNPFWYNRFYLHRALQEVQMEHPALGLVSLWNVHLEAFDTRNNLRHIEILTGLLEADPAHSALVGGDFNAIPADATRRSGFVDEPEMSFEDSTSMKTYFELSGFEDVVGKRDQAEAFTFPTELPTRRLDYMTFHPGVWIGTGSVLREESLRPLSDHLPLVGEFTKRAEGGEASQPEREGSASPN